jgi:hypothetical protein
VTFTGFFATPFRETVLVEQDVALELQAPRRGPPARHGRPMLVEIRHVEARHRASAGDARLGGAHGRRRRGETGHRRAEAVLEIQPANLAVGHDLEAEAFLEADRVSHRLVLDASELLLRQAAFVERGAGFPPRRRTEQAAHHVGA